MWQHFDMNALMKTVLDTVAEITGLDVDMGNWSEQDLILVVGSAYWAYLVFSWSYRSAFERRGRKSTGRNGSVETMNVKRRPTKKKKWSIFRKIVQNKQLLISTFLYYVFTKGSGSSTTSMMVNFVLFSGMRNGVGQLVDNLLPKPVWGRDSLKTWIRLIVLSSVVFPGFYYVAQKSKDVFIISLLSGAVRKIILAIVKVAGLGLWTQSLVEVALGCFCRIKLKKPVISFMYFSMATESFSAAVMEMDSDVFRAPFSYFVYNIVSAPLLFIVGLSGYILYTAYDEKLFRRLQKKEVWGWVKFIYGISSLREDALVTLGVTDKSSMKQIKKAFREKSRVVHPDKNPSQSAMTQFMELQAAYDTLTRKQSRKDTQEEESKTIAIIMDILLWGVFYFFEYYRLFLNAVNATKLYYKQKKENLGHVFVSQQAKAEWDALNGGIGAFELYVISAFKNEDIGRCATKWLHTLKKYRNSRAKTSFAQDVVASDEFMNSCVSKFKNSFYEACKKQNKTTPIQQSNFLEEIVTDFVMQAYIYRTYFLKAKQAVVEIFLDRKKNMKELKESLDHELKDLQDQLSIFRDEISEFCKMAKVDEPEDEALNELPVVELVAMKAYYKSMFRHKTDEVCVAVLKSMLKSEYYEFDLSYQKNIHTTI